MSGDPVRFVAEVSSNHHGSLTRCLEFVDRAAQIGCHAVKFQLFRLHELFAPEILERSPKHRERAAWELPLDFLPPLAERARELGLQFACTPFDLSAVQQLVPHVDFLKIASYELLWHRLLEECAATHLPIVISTGMADLEETTVAVEVLEKAGCRDLTVLHCVSGYPTPPAEANLAALDTLRVAVSEGIRIGWSDHTVEPGVIHRAVHQHDASLIEFHLDLDGQGAEYASGHCWLPEAMAAVIRDVGVAATAGGDGEKRPANCEIVDRDWRADPGDGLRPLLATRKAFAP